MALVSSAPAEPIRILSRSDYGPDPDGSYKYSYETENGIKVDEEGQIKPDGEEGTASVRGSYSYQGDDGNIYQLSYTADENGYKPEGAHLPQVPDIPVAILRALEWIALHPEEDNL